MANNFNQIIDFVINKFYIKLFLTLNIRVLVGILLILPSDLGSLIGFFSFTAWIFYGLTAATTIILRFTHKDLHRPYKVPIIIPILVVIASIYLVLAPIVKDPRIEFLYAFLFLASGILVYLPFVYGGYNPSWSAISNIRKNITKKITEKIGVYQKLYRLFLQFYLQLLKTKQRYSNNKVIYIFILNIFQMLKKSKGAGCVLLILKQSWAFTIDFTIKIINLT
ncbi:hypothetical protein KUTeg_019912 [Tegillarca granosa]|uniref:Uncharacterized protein n=1 Tax=Tegillarca granosa TaxID=220873 RepID=A0ABQ9EDU1_TEGGR|nr:hypothetical protein KUTeg_019912 [Tegillarca granosa]